MNKTEYESSNSRHKKHSFDCLRNFSAGSGAIIRGLEGTVTIYEGRGGQTGEKPDILYCVITRFEIGSVKNIANAIDETAFIITHSLADVEGGVIKRRALH